jgi:ribosome hibernation promoting factor
LEINVTFRHAESSKVLREHIQEKINRLSKYFIKPTNAHVILNVEGTRHMAEISFSENHSLFNAKALSHDMYLSVDRALAKIERQLKKYKEKLKGHHKKPSRSPQIRRLA